MLRRLASPPPLCAGRRARPSRRGPQFWRVEGARAFLEGELAGLSLDSEGRLRLGAAPCARSTTPRRPTPGPSRATRRASSTSGPGNDGRVMKVDGGKGSLLFDAEELEVHALAVGPGRPRLRGHLARRRRLRDRRRGQGHPLLRPRGEVHLGARLRRAGALYVATGGEGRVYRVAKDGSAEADPDRLRHARALARRRRQGRRVRGQRARGHRLPHRRLGEGLRRARLRVPRDQGARRRRRTARLRRRRRRHARPSPRPGRPRPRPPRHRAARATSWPRSP